MERDEEALFLRSLIGRDPGPNGRAELVVDLHKPPGPTSPWQ